MGGALVGLALLPALLGARPSRGAAWAAILFADLSLGLAWLVLANCRRSLGRYRSALRGARALAVRNRALISAVPDLLFEMDLEGRYHACFSSHPELLASPREKLLGSTVAAALPAPAAAEILAGLREAHETGRSMGRTYELDLPQGRFWFELAIAPRPTGPGQPPRFIVLSRDVTERKRAEQALVQSQESFASLFRHAVLGLYRTAPDGRILMANQALIDMLGHRSFEELAQVRFDHNPTYPLERFRRELAEKGRVDGFESTWTRPDGVGVILRESARTVRDPAGILLYVEGIVEDFTAHRRMEEERSRLQAQLVQAQRLESLGSLAGGVAHDMNNVLGAILAMASTHVELQPPESPARKAFDTISRAAVRGGQMVQRLLRLAHAGPAEERVVDVNAILTEEMNLLEHTTLARIHLHLDLDPDLRPVRGDPSALTHAFMNLCVNAVDAMTANGTLTLCTRNREAGEVEVVVADTGCGMAPEVLEKAMDPFFTTKEMGKGTGLGLSMVYSTVRAHQGRIDIQSQPGRGTRVRLRLPACPDPVPAPAPAAAPSPARAARPLAILLVDDDDLVQASVLDLLATLGHRPAGVLSGEEAVARVTSGYRPDLVLLDMNMPGLGGKGTLPRLRALLPDTPVLLATGRVDREAQALAEADPAVSLLPKPFTLETLRDHLAKSAAT